VKNERSVLGARGNRETEGNCMMTRVQFELEHDRIFRYTLCTVTNWEIQNFDQIVNRKTSAPHFSNRAFGVDVIIYELSLCKCLSGKRWVDGCVGRKKAE